MPLSPGHVLNNRYRIVRLLGQGGFGAVYRAWDINLELPCALKENTETSSAAGKQFLREAQILHTLRHPNLPLVKDHFIIPDQGQYLVMDFIDGKDLQEKIAAETIPVPQAVSWVVQICEALEYMHTQTPAVIHRDIKPANIKITPAGKAVLVDFGIAKVFDAKSRTTAGARAITAGYSPFEQYGSAPTDARTDIYALGATLYALLTGQEPVESIARVAGTELTPPSQVDPEVSPALEQALLTALKVMPVDRYQTATEFKAALLEALAELAPLVAPPASAVRQADGVAQPALGLRPPSTPQAARPPSTPQAAHPPSTPRPVEPASVKPKKPLPWKWIAIGGAAVLLLVCAPLTYFGVRTLSEGDGSAAVSPSTASERETRTEVPVEAIAVEEENCHSPELLCIGLVTDGAPIDGHGLTQAAWEGIQQIQAEYGALVNYLETVDANDYDDNITYFANRGYDVIVTSSWLMSDVTVDAAIMWPEIYFIGVDQYQDTVLPNLAGLIFHYDRAGFLAGALAANLTRSGVIGGVYATDIIPPQVALKEGFEAGVAYVNPTLNVYSTYHPGSLDIAFTDPEWGAAVAYEYIASGIDVLFGVGGATGSGALEAAASQSGIYCIGVDVDQWYTVPAAQPCLVSSAIWRIDLGVYDLIRAYMDDASWAGNFYGQIALAPFHDFDYLLTADLNARLTDIAERLNTGRLSTGYAASVEPTAAPVASETNITIWHQWDDSHLNAIQVIFNDYMAMHPGVSITLEKPEDMSAALQTAIPAGGGPDIIAWNIDQIGTQALNGNIIDLSLVGVSMEELRYTYEPAAASGMIWQDAIWALPETQEGIAIIYDTALASASDFPSDPLDFWSLLDYAAEYYNRTGRYLFCNPALSSTSGEAYHTAPIWFGFGVPGYVDDWGNAYMNTPEALAAAYWMLEYRPYAPYTADYAICRDMLIEGQTAAWWSGPWGLTELDAAGIDYAILPMGRPFVNVRTLSITSNALYRGTADYALDIMRYYTNPENSIYLSLNNNTVPANSTALWSTEVQALETIAGFGASLNLGIPISNTPFSGAQWSPVADATRAIWTGALTPEEALAIAQQQMEDAIANMR